MRVLFVLKYRENNWGQTGGGFPSSGLLNSATFVHEMLLAAGVESKLVQVGDNNKIDAEVHKWRPTHVIIEAYWVVPDKFEILQRLHPNVKWIIRNHSETPFLANEGIALEWTRKYVLHPNVWVSCNSMRALTDFSAFIPREKIAFLPNFYPVMFGSPDGEWPHSRHADGPLHIACPGAVRPLKNHLIQAVAALKAARSLNRYLIFHVNSTRVECSGSNVLKNLRALFDGLPYGELVEEEWRDHGAFKDFLGTMDVVMQVSYTETFNIVGADAVAMGVPLVASPEIVWSDPRHQCPCDDSEQQALAILQALQHPRPAFARMRLKQHVQDVPEIWMKQLSLT